MLNQEFRQTALQTAQPGATRTLPQLLKLLPLDFDELLFQFLKSPVAFGRAVKALIHIPVIGRQFIQACLLDFAPGDIQNYPFLDN
jgi:hypothetical protein